MKTSSQSQTESQTGLRVVLVVVGLGFTFGLAPMMLLWPSGWAWGHGHAHYMWMIVGIYSTLGAFLLAAAVNPPAHRSLISFTIVSSVVHAAIMAAQAIGDPAERGHFLGDVPALLIVAVLLTGFTRGGRHRANLA